MCGIVHFLVSIINYYLVSIPIHKICTVCGTFSAISLLLTTENSDDLEIRVSDGSKLLKLHQRIPHVSSPINHCNQGCVLYERIAFDRSSIVLFC